MIIGKEIVINQTFGYRKINPIKVKLIPQYIGWRIFEYMPCVTSLSIFGFPKPTPQFSASVRLADHHKKRPAMLITIPVIFTKFKLEKTI